VGVHLFYFFIERLQRLVRVGSLTQQSNAGNYVIVVDDFSVFTTNRQRGLSKPNLGALRNHGDIFYAYRRAAFGLDDGVLDIAHVSNQAHFLDVDLLQTVFHEASAGIGVVVGELLLHLRKAEAV
jgi:hypothetical protein